ncbi:hypothetical protein [Nonomuraea maritima]|uniref:hypothetical protein n=1 Tax=Nonomuraea maritima TaxID=683260 RepID=UPI00372154DB
MKARIAAVLASGAMLTAAIAAPAAAADKDARSGGSAPNGVTSTVFGTLLGRLGGLGL